MFSDTRRVTLFVGVKLSYMLCMDNRPHDQAFTCNIYIEHSDGSTEMVDMAEAFRSAWNQVKIQPVYGILDERLAILSCSFVLGEKVYPGANAYSEDDLSEMTLETLK